MTMAENAFVYTTYNNTPPQRQLQPLNDPTFTTRYWGTEFDADWAVGAPMVWHFAGVEIADPAHQVVVEYEPYRRLSYTWHSITPEFGRAVNAEDGQVASMAAEPRSKVTFDIEPTEHGVKLTVIHDGFEAGSAILEGISGGWPMILSALKSLLESTDPELVAL